MAWGARNSIPHRRLGKFRPARQEFDGCAKLLDESTVVPEDADGLFRGASPATVQARALYHAARATQAPSLDVGARSRLERAASLLPPPDEPWPGRAELCGNQPVRRVHPIYSSLSHFSAMTWPRWLRRAVRN